jgi:hypothetical protein
MEVQQPSEVIALTIAENQKPGRRSRRKAERILEALRKAGWRIIRKSEDE